MGNSSRSRRTLEAFLLFFVVLVAACGRETTAERSADRIESVSPGATAVHESPISQILQFTAPKLGGGEVIGSELQGSDLAIWFWAPW